MGTKNKPGDYDCYANAEPDEPMFILLARDPLAPLVVSYWATLRRESRGPSAKVNEALQCAEHMGAWYNANCVDDRERAP